MWPESPAARRRAAPVDAAIELAQCARHRSLARAMLERWSVLLAERRAAWRLPPMLAGFRPAPRPRPTGWFVLLPGGADNRLTRPTGGQSFLSPRSAHGSIAPIARALPSMRR